MIIDIPKIPPEGTNFDGEELPEILALEDDKFAKAGGVIRYSFFVNKIGSELIVQGTVEAPIQLLCGRCGGFFSTSVSIPSFLHTYEITEVQETVDVTPDIREDILLELPSYPKCPWAGRGVCPHSGVDLRELKIPENNAGDDRWGALDGLKPPADGRKKKTVKQGPKA